MLVYICPMKFVRILLYSLTITLLFQGSSVKRIDYRHGMHNNVCKTLKDNVLVYFIFVDTKETAPWTEFDINTTLDSMAVAIQWIKSQAELRGIPLKISTDYYIGSQFTTVQKNLEYGTVLKTATTPNLNKGLDGLNKWADAIAARVGKEVIIKNKEKIPEIKNPRNKERLIAHLRDEWKVESVALLFLVNNYYRSDISVTVNHLDNSDIEFSVVSYKYPSVIAQNILNLFGAADLSKSLYRNNEKKIRLASEYFPNDIMQDVYGKPADRFEIGAYSEYLIGWREILDPMYSLLLTDR